MQRSDQTICIIKHNKKRIKDRKIHFAHIEIKFTNIYPLQLSKDYMAQSFKQDWLLKHIVMEMEKVKEKKEHLNSESHKGMKKKRRVSCRVVTPKEFHISFDKL